jgi:hypothetical protein
MKEKLVDDYELKRIYHKVWDSLSDNERHNLLIQNKILKQEPEGEHTNLDGVSFQLEQPDIDGDGQTGGVEKIQLNPDVGITSINQSTELNDVLMNLDEKKSIDMNARLHPMVLSPIAAFKTFVYMQWIPPEWRQFPDTFLGLTVSLKGTGRKEKIEAIVGKRERDTQAAGGFGGAMGKLFGGGGNEGQGGQK